MKIFTLLLLVSLHAFGQVWKTTSTGQVNAITGIDFVDANVGYMVGNSGIILKTTDAGSTWTDVSINNTSSNVAIDAVSSNVVFVTDYYHVYRTTNGGASWSSVLNTEELTIAIDFYDANIGYVTGYNGYIAKTTDGGSTWNRQTSGSTSITTSMKSFDANVKVVVGGIGEIIRTTDAGTLWTHIYAPENPTDLSNTPLNDMVVLDANTALAVGNSGTIIKTTNKGASWSSITFSPGGNINRIHFYSSTSGFIVVDHNKIYKTSNSGAAWTLTYTDNSSSINDIHAISATSAYANYDNYFLDYSTSNPVANAASSITSTSFQASWQSNVVATHYYLDVATNSDFSSMVSGYNNKDMGTAVNHTVTGLSPFTVYYYRIRMHDGTNTSTSSASVSVTTVIAAPVAVSATSVSSYDFTANWNSVTGVIKFYLDVAKDSNFTDFVTGFNNKDVGNVTSYSITGLNSLTSYYYRVRAYSGVNTSVHSNRITTTTLIPGPPTAQAASKIYGRYFTANWGAVAGATKYYLDVATDIGFTSFVADYENVDVGNVLSVMVGGLTANATYYYRVRTYDGTTLSLNSNIITATTNNYGWSSVANSFSAYLNAVRFPTLDNGVISGSSGLILRTSNGGGTWEQITSGSTSTLNAISFVDTNIGYISGENATVLKTTNGGTSWNAISGLTGGFFEIQFISEDTGYAVRGLSSDFVSTTDGGNTWQTTDMAPGGNNIMLRFLVRGNTRTFLGVLTGTSNFGYIIHSTDNGQNFATQHLSSNLLFGLEYVNKDTGYVCGDAGTILKTTNGGTTWVQQTSGVTNSLGSIKFADANHGVAVGLGGTIVMTTNGGATWEKHYTGITTDLNSAAYLPSGIVFAVGNGGTILQYNTLLAPVVLNATGLQAAQFTANWNAASGATTYYLDVATDNQFSNFVSGYNNVDVGNVTSYSVSGLTTGVTYYYRVRASDGTLTSVASLSKSATPQPTAVTYSDGSYDTGFSTDGKLTSGFAGNDFGRTVALQSDGKIVVAGESNGNVMVARYNTDGTIDNTFDTDGKAIADIGGVALVGGVALQSDGKIVVVGNVTIAEVEYELFVVRFNTDGSIDNTFSSDGKDILDIGVSSSDGAYAVAIQSDDAIVVAGYTDDNFALVRYLTNGTLDTSFDTDGIVITDFGGYDNAFAMTIQPDGKIVLAGQSAGLTLEFAVARYTTSGALDTDFSGDGKVTTDLGGFLFDQAFGVTTLSDGRIAVSGYADSYAPGEEAVVLVYSSAGVLDNTFGTGGIASFDFGGDDYALSIVEQADTRILIAGSSDNDMAVARLLPSGALDNTFSSDGKLTIDLGAVDKAHSVVLQSDNKIILAGFSGDDIALVRLGGSAAPLPVELVLFTATAKRMNTELKWETATELNNHGFEIERRTASDSHLQGDSHSAWTKTGFVEGNGTSNASKEYAYTDKVQKAGKYFYRLKQIDRDGKFAYSQEVEVEVGTVLKVFALDQNYPNPFNPATTIGFTLQNTGLTTLKIYDIVGREVATLVNNELLEAGVYHQKQFNASHLASGVYFARLQSGSNVQLKKLMLIK
jgi:uncharacterized delta-60 repeat protein